MANYFSKLSFLSTGKNGNNRKNECNHSDSTCEWQHFAKWRKKLFHAIYEHYKIEFIGKRKRSLSNFNKMPSKIIESKHCLRHNGIESYEVAGCFTISKIIIIIITEAWTIPRMLFQFKRWANSIVKLYLCNKNSLLSKKLSFQSFCGLFSNWTIANGRNYNSSMKTKPQELLYFELVLQTNGKWTTKRPNEMDNLPKGTKSKISSWTMNNRIVYEKYKIIWIMVVFEW